MVSIRRPRPSAPLDEGLPAEKRPDWLAAYRELLDAPVWLTHDGRPVAHRAFPHCLRAADLSPWAYGRGDFPLPGTVDATRAQVTADAGRDRWVELDPECGADGYWELALTWCHRCCPGGLQ